jgi:hypothetical protein
MAVATPSLEHLNVGGGEGDGGRHGLAATDANTMDSTDMVSNWELYLIFFIF